MIDRGAIYVMAEKGTYTGKPRPVIIVQNPSANLASVLMVPLTTYNEHVPDIRVKLDPDESNGLKKPSFAMCDKLSAIAVVNLGKRIGSASEAQMDEIKKTLFYLLDDSKSELPSRL